MQAAAQPGPLAGIFRSGVNLDVSAKLIVNAQLPLFRGSMSGEN